MSLKSGTVDEDAVTKAGGQVLQGACGVRIGGWTITTQKGPITADADVEQIKERLGTLAAPEQFFGGNALRLTHDASGTSLSFTALDALKGWLQDKSARVQVSESQDWLKSRQREVERHGAQTLEYDWTYTTGYAGTLTQACSSSGGTGGAIGSSAPGGTGSGTTAAAAAPPSPAAAGGAAAVGQQPAEPSEGRPAQPALPGQQVGAAPAWQHSESGINRSLLTARDPILYWDELPLYESELDDHGTSKCTVKVRVMPRCWYVLLRFWLRVDRVMVRLRETRVFCQFDSPQRAALVLREIRYHEGTFAELRAAGAPAEGPAYADSDVAAAALMAVAPVGVTQYRMEQLQL